MTKTLPIVNWICRIVLALMFFYTGWIKIEAPLQFAVTLSGYQLFPAALVPWIAQCFPWVEIVLGVLLLLEGVVEKFVTFKIRYAALASAALLLVFTIMLSITYARGIDTNCGCFNFSDQISLKTIVRDSVILLPALYLLLERWFWARHASGGRGRV